MSSAAVPARTAEERALITAAGFAWDLAIQLAKLRRARGLTQEGLAQRLGLSLVALSRLENPLDERHSLRALRTLAGVLGAYVDVVLVPQEQLDAYLATRSQPVLEETTP